jgi:hypothetical protein
MSDDHVMASADSAKAASAAVALVARLGSFWDMIEGPAQATFTLRRKQGPDQTVRYEAFVPFYRPDPAPVSGVRDLGQLVELMQDGFDQRVLSFNRMADVLKDRVVPIITPKTFRIVWRDKPHFSRGLFGDDRWYGYMRLGLMPCDGCWLLDAAPPPPQRGEAVELGVDGFPVP